MFFLCLIFFSVEESKIVDVTYNLQVSIHQIPAPFPRSLISSYTEPQSNYSLRSSWILPNTEFFAFVIFSAYNALLLLSS